MNSQIAKWQFFDHVLRKFLTKLLPIFHAYNTNASQIIRITFEKDEEVMNRMISELFVSLGLLFFVKIHSANNVFIDLVEIWMPSTNTQNCFDFADCFGRKKCKRETLAAAFDSTRINYAMKEMSISKYRSDAIGSETFGSTFDHIVIAFEALALMMVMLVSAVRTIFHALPNAYSFSSNSF